MPPKKNAKQAWNQAESEYADLFASLAFPMFSEPLSPEDIVARMQRILKICPWFYPAYMEKGIRLLAANQEKQGMHDVRKGFELMREHCPPDEITDRADPVLENLARLYRFDISQICVQILLQTYPDIGLFHDFMAHNAAMLGQEEQAVQSIAKALELEPDNVHFRSNQGWIHLIFGNLPQAEQALHKAIQIDPEDRVVLGNLEVLEYLKHNGGTYVDYLLSPTPREDIEALMDEERWEEVDRMVEQSNSGLLEAMGMIAVRTGQPQVTVLADRISTLEQFLGFIDKITQDPFFYEQIALVQFNFKKIMHKFIFKFKDVDEDLIEDIYISLFDFYHFLAEQDIIEASDVDELKKEALGMKKDLLATMHRYNAIRHDPTLEQEEKESLREEIFEGDHFWPFID